MLPIQARRRSTCMKERSVAQSRFTKVREKERRSSAPANCHSLKSGDECVVENSEQHQCPSGERSSPAREVSGCAGSEGGAALGWPGFSGSTGRDAAERFLTTENTEQHGNEIRMCFHILCPSQGRAHARRVGSHARRVGSFRGYYVS